MKRKMIMLSMAMLMFFAVPLRANAATQYASGEMGGYDVSGFLEITASYAQASTGCQNRTATVNVSLTYYYVNETSGEVLSSSSNGVNSGSVGTSVSKPKSEYRSYKATSTHSVTLGSYQWNPSEMSVYY